MPETGSPRPYNVPSLYEGWAVIPRRPRGHYIRLGVALCKGTIIFRRRKSEHVPQPLEQYQCRECHRKLAAIIKRGLPVPADARTFYD